MKAAKKILFFVTGIVVLGGLLIGVMIWNDLRSGRLEVKSAFENGKIKIVQVNESWKIKGDEKLNLEVYLKNESENPLSMFAQFECRLSNKGYDQQFLTSLIESYGESNLMEHIEKRVRSRTLNEQPILFAAYNYIKRGYRLEDSLNYEPAPDSTEPYSLSFYETAYLLPNENMKIERSLVIPPIYSGRKLEVVIKSVKSNRKIF